MEARLERRDPAASLTDDLFVGILSRLPARSVCCCKCVSPSWRRLISHPDHRKKLPQPLAGFLHTTLALAGRSTLSTAYRCAGVTGLDGRSFSFSPRCTGCGGDGAVLLDSCNGLLLWRCSQPGPHGGGGGRSGLFRYAVSNPATKKWVALPDGGWGDHGRAAALLAFDPAASSHFHVVEYLTNKISNFLMGILIYSSETGAWSFKKCGWGYSVELSVVRATGVFLNGFLHTHTSWGTIVALDMKGESWKSIPVPCRAFSRCICMIHQTQGRLCLVTRNDDDALAMLIWVLEDYGKWTLKHTVRSLKLLERRNLCPYPDVYKLVAVHPDCNMMFFVFGADNTLMAYQMDRREVRVICNLGPDCFPPYLPYVPFFGEFLADNK
ncbi:hypothetical protein ACP4OV_009596 [Aristida adscensionis]